MPNLLYPWNLNVQIVDVLIKSIVIMIGFAQITMAVNSMDGWRLNLLFMNKVKTAYKLVSSKINSNHWLVYEKCGFGYFYLGFIEK